MTNDMGGMATRIQEALAKAPSKTAIAEACGVTPQAVTGWIKKGSIAKEHLPTIAKLCGVDLNWLITGRAPAGEPHNDPKQHKIDLIVHNASDFSDAELRELLAQIDLINRRKRGLL